MIIFFSIVANIINKMIAIVAKNLNTVILNFIELIHNDNFRSIHSQKLSENSKNNIFEDFYSLIGV
jgi:hypothetical protein